MITLTQTVKTPNQNKNAFVLLNKDNGVRIYNIKVVTKVEHYVIDSEGNTWDSKYVKYSLFSLINALLKIYSPFSNFSTDDINSN